MACSCSNYRSAYYSRVYAQFPQQLERVYDGKPVPDKRKISNAACKHGGFL